ncbi:MAG TPA: malate dehydrogenase, partial [candidate division Zixibacteria bacterium]|nr:malate dehydrogenase [candidate division Zixibacteria bacterium]
MNKKIGVIGAGNVGASCAQYIAEANLADVVMLDIVEGIPQGKALDLTQAGPVRGYNCTITGTNDYNDLAGADLVIVTAGLARKPGMSREDLLNKNADIVGSVAENIARVAPETFVVVVSNPLDIMTYHFRVKSGFPSHRVVGQAGVLDSIRMRAFIAMELGVAMSDTQALVLGGHGDTMVPLPRYSTVSGIPISELISKERIDAIADRARVGGGEIVKLLGTGSAYYAPAAASVDMAKAILNDEKRMLAASALCEGQYGINDLYIGVPIILGGGGVEKIIELDLAKDELESLQNSAKTYKETLAILGYAEAHA